MKPVAMKNKPSRAPGKSHLDVLKQDLRVLDGVLTRSWGLPAAVPKSKGKPALPGRSKASCG